MCMYKKNMCLISVILLLGMVGSALAVDVNWTNGGGDRLWRNASNWDPNVPTGADKAAIRASIPGPIIDSSTTAVANVIVCGDWGQTDTVDITGGSLTTGGWFILGYASGDEGTFNVSGGTTTCNQNLHVGFNGAGHVNMTAGTVTVTSTFGIATQTTGSGDVQLDGGTISCNSFSMTTSASMDIGGGTLIVNGDVTSTINGYIGNGWLIAYGDAGTLDVDYDNTNPGKTTVTAIPTETDPPTPNPASFASVPAAISDTAISMTATAGSDVSGPVEYYFDEVTGNSGGTDSGWITSNSYTDTGLTGNTTYTYTVTMRDLFGNEGTASGGESATTWAATTTTIVWNPAGNGIFPPATGDWDDSGNWTTSAADRPDGNFKAVFNVSGAAECVVSGPQSLMDIVQGSGGPGGVIRVVDGGKLTTIGGWMSIGFNNTATLIVETGGVCDFGGHLWWGMQNTGVGTIEINGGTIIGRENFGLGWFNGGQNGVAHCYVNSGLLDLDHWSGTLSIHDGSVLDIELGSVTINGDRTGDVAGYVTAGKITAYGGTGRVLYDYNATNPGKTTIKAVEGVEGDVDGDGDVDFDDVVLFVQDWLDVDCESPANFVGYCIIDLHDFAILASNWLSGNISYWHVASTIYPTDDTIVTPYYADNLGIVGDGVTDVTDALQTALISLDNMGGGALFLPAGNYKVSGTLTVPARVTLRGDWQKPEIGSPVVGTILQAYAGRNDENGTPFIELSGSAGVNGITIWYPEQLPTDIQPYPPTIHGGGNTVENVTFVNSYIGFTTYREGITARPFVRNVYGTPLKTGIEYDCLADIGRIETVHFSPDYWADSGLANAPTAGQHETWIYNNGTGMIVRRIDWSYSCYVTVEGYNIGLALRPSRYDGKVPNGQSYMFSLTDCETGVYVEASAGAGYQLTRFDIQGAETGVYLGTSTAETNMLHTCSINASGDAILSEGTAMVMMMSSDIQQGIVRLDGGYLSVINSNFTSTTTNHIELASGVHGASILGNSFTGGARILDNTTYPVNIDHTPLTVDPMPAYDYKKPATGFKAAKSDLYVVTKSPYYAQADGVTDDTAAFQAALTDADANGGGIVFVPGGDYRIDGNLTVPTGVELKGVFDVPHSTRDKGSLLNVYAGRNNASGTPFIQIESGAGIRGLAFHYPEQIYDPCDTVNYGMVPYPFLIRGLGSDVYVINIAATIPYQLLDLATNRCDRHYVDYILSTALKTGIHVGNGSEDGQIHNCQFNPSAYTHQGLYYDSIPLNTGGGIHAILWRDSTPYLFGNMSGEVLHENFVFGGMKGVHLVEEGGFGPSGYSLGMGVDACTTAFHIDDVGSSGLDMINSQIVSTNDTIGHYLETGASFDDTFKLFSSAGWGGHQYSVVINGGDVKLQLFHLARAGEAGAFQVFNNASLQNLGGNLTDTLDLPLPFLTIDLTATAEFIGNVIDTEDPSQMPANDPPKVISIGNLRVQ